MATVFGGSVHYMARERAAATGHQGPQEVGRSVQIFEHFYSLPPWQERWPGSTLSAESAQEDAGHPFCAALYILRSRGEEVGTAVSGGGEEGCEEEIQASSARRGAPVRGASESPSCVEGCEEDSY